MSAATAQRIRWFAVWILIAIWFAGLSFKWFGDFLNLLLGVAALLVVYELMAENGDSKQEGAGPGEVQALSVSATAPGGSAGRRGTERDRGRPGR